MPRGNLDVAKVFYKGHEDDFLIYVDDVSAARAWRQDRTIPLADVVSGWKVFVTHHHGAQGVHDTASKAMLHNEFGTSNEDDVIKQILEKGELQESEAPERYGGKKLGRE